MAKQRKLLTREQILSIPDAPKGQRFCDDVEGEQKAAEQFWRCLAIKYEAAGKLTGDAKANFWKRALAVLKATGLSVDEFNHLNWKDSILVMRAAAELKTHERAELLAAMQGLLDKAETPPETETPGTDWDRPDHKAAVVKWIRTEYWKNSKANKAGAIRAALVHFGLPCDYERRVRTEYDKRQKK